MNYNSILNPGVVKASCRQFISYLQSEKEVYNHLRNKVEDFVNDNSIQGESIKALKMQVNNYSMILGSLSISNDMDINDAQTLIDIVGDETLNGQEIFQGQATAKSDASSYGSSASSCYQKAYNATDNDSISYWRGMGNYYDGLVAAANERYRYYCGKEQKYDDINSASGNLFTDSADARNNAKSLLDAMTTSYVDGVYDDSKCAPLRIDLKKFYDENKLSLYSEEYIYGSAGRFEVVVDWDAVNDILSKDIDDITPEEWEALAELAFLMNDGDIDDLVSCFIDAKYNENGGIQIGVDEEKFNKMLEYMNIAYYGNEANDYTRDDGIDKDAESMFRRIVLMNAIPIDEIQNNYFDLYEHYRDDFDSDEEYLAFVKSILGDEASAYIPRINITTDYNGNYTIIVYPTSIDDLGEVVVSINVNNYYDEDYGIRFGLGPGFIAVYDSNGNIYYGGDQGWFDGIDGDIANSGCGAIAAVNTYLYLAGITSISKDDYMALVQEYVDNYLLSHKQLEWGFGADPLTMGNFIRDKLKDQGIDVSTDWLEYDSHDQWDTIKRMIAEGRPVIWGLFDLGSIDFFSGNNGSNEDGVTLYVDNNGEFVPSNQNQQNSHYVTITGLIEQPQPDGSTRRMLEVSSWGETYYIDYDEYLEMLKDYDNPAEAIANGIGSSIMYIED